MTTDHGAHTAHMAIGHGHMATNYEYAPDKDLFTSHYVAVLVSENPALLFPEGSMLGAVPFSSLMLAFDATLGLASSSSTRALAASAAPVGTSRFGTAIGVMCLDAWIAAGAIAVAAAAEP